MGSKCKATCPKVPLPACRCASSHLPQGDGFWQCRKVCRRHERRPLGGAGERSETEGVFPPARMFPQETSAENAVCRYDPTREKGVLKSPQAFQNPKIKIILPLQQRRPPPAAETGRSCWGSGQQDASAAQGTQRMLGAATRKKRSAFQIVILNRGSIYELRTGNGIHPRGAMGGA